LSTSLFQSPFLCELSDVVTLQVCKAPNQSLSINESGPFPALSPPWPLTSSQGVHDHFALRRPFLMPEHSLFRPYAFSELIEEIKMILWELLKSDCSVDTSWSRQAARELFLLSCHQSESPFFFDFQLCPFKTGFASTLIHAHFHHPYGQRESRTSSNFACRLGCAAFLRFSISPT